MIGDTHEARPGGPMTTDHLVQIGEKMILTRPDNICSAEDLPPPVKIQLTNSEYPVPEVWKEAEYAFGAERPPINWVHQFNTEGHWVLKAGFTCYPGGTNDPSTTDKTGQVIVGKEKTMTIHVVKPERIKQIGVWHGDQLPQTAEDWETLKQGIQGYEASDDWYSTFDGDVKWVLYQVPHPDHYTPWAKYYIDRGSRVLPPDSWKS